MTIVQNRCVVRAAVETLEQRFLLSGKVLQQNPELHTAPYAPVTVQPSQVAALLVHLEISVAEIVAAVEFLDLRDALLRIERERVRDLARRTRELEAERERTTQRTTWACKIQKCSPREHRSPRGVRSYRSGPE